MPDIDLTIFLLLLVAAFTAGWVDAVVGGGGLVQLPVLMLVPGITPLQALATNKVASITGTAVASVTYARRVKVDIRTAIPLSVTAFLGAVLGAFVATFIPEEAFTPIILIVVVGVGTFTLFKPQMGLVTALRWRGTTHLIAAGLIGLGIGLYDGALGPGTGSFFVILLVSVLGYGFMPASALAKIANLCTNAGALLFFAGAGHVLWGLGAVMAVANIIGAYLGARMAVSRGSGFVRVVFMIVLGILAVKLTTDMF